jgi:hypothetical protein
MLRQLPLVPPVFAAEHDMQVPLQVVLQQTLSMQLPLVHSVFLEQAAPLGKVQPSSIWPSQLSSIPLKQISVTGVPGVQVSCPVMQLTLRKQAPMPQVRVWPMIQEQPSLST